MPLPFLFPFATGIPPPLRRTNSFNGVMGPSVAAGYGQFPGLADYHTLVMHRYVPKLAALMLQYGLKPNAAVTQLIAISTDTDENGGPGGLPQRHLQYAYKMLLETVEATALSGSESAVTAQLERLLERQFQKDNNDLTGLGDRGYWRSVRFFRGLAEVSKQTESRHLGRLLRTFIVFHGPDIAESGQTLAVAYWCCGILRLHISPEERVACLRAILKCRPEIIDELEEQPHFSANAIFHEAAKDIDTRLGRRVRGRQVNRLPRGLLSPSSSPEPVGMRRNQLLLGSDNNNMDPFPGRSLPANRQIVRQAEKLRDTADVLRVQAENLAESIRR